MNKVPRARITPVGTPMWPRWANDRDGSKESDFQWIRLVVGWLVAEFQCPQDSKKARITPMWPWWANGHDIAYLQAQRFLVNMVWSESAAGEFPASARFQSLCLNSYYTMWFWWAVGSRWANDHDVVHLQAKTVPVNLKWIHPVTVEFWCLQDSRSPYCPMGALIRPRWANDHDVPMNRLEFIGPFTGYAAVTPRRVVLTCVQRVVKFCHTSSHARHGRRTILIRFANAVHVWGTF